jgi:hypothetical protein
MPTTQSPSPEITELVRPRNACLPRRSPWLIGWFRRYVQWYLPRHFTAVRLARCGRRPQGLTGPVVVVLNHPSWWDPLLCLVLSDLFPGYKHYAPIDARALEQYRFFARLGFFGVELGSFRGARGFLETGLAILNEPNSVLWVTGQGRFTDVRIRPLRLEPGLGHLLARAPRATVLPLALELVFWNERLPEALLRFGKPLEIDMALSPAAWTQALEAALAANQETLATQAMSRSPEHFDTLLVGRRGVGFSYDWWRRLRSVLTGQPQRGGPE